MSTLITLADKSLEKRLRKRLKLVLRPQDPDKLSVIITEVYDVSSGDSHEQHFVVSFGGNKSIEIIGEEDWDTFLELLDATTEWAETTQDIPIVEVAEPGE